MSPIQKLTSASITQAANIIKSGGVIAIPTDTVYGLSAGAFDREAIRRIFEIKRRPETSPMITLVKHMDDIQKLAVVDGRALKLAKAFWPGPLTVVLRRLEGERRLDAACAGLRTATFRIPDSGVDLEIIEQAGAPIVSTSANVSGQENPQTAEEVLTQLGEDVGFILDGGRSPQNKPSTIIDLTGKDWKLLRPGTISEEDIRKII
jgi:L-threonylcarbamoyladenylate synthase